MPCRYYFWSLILTLFSCATFLHRGDFERGLACYKKGDFHKAAEYFNSHYTKHPESDSVLYYLYSCYQKLDQPERGLKLLEQLAEIGSKDEDVYLNLFYYYRKNSQYRNLFTLLVNVDPVVNDILNEHFCLTRRLFAEIISGASTKTVHSDPLVFATSHGYLTLLPDGKFYENDTITKGNLIVLLDHLVDPVYPKNFFQLRNVSNHSFLYLPYMRLIDHSILNFDPDLDPRRRAPISMAVQAIVQLKKRGFIE